MSKLLKEHPFKTKPIVKGYTDRILYINLSDLSIKEKDVPPVMKEKFIGGKGYGLRLLWDATKPDTKWNDPENEIIIAPGPLCGVTQYAGAGKSLVVTISPTTDLVIDSNVGGHAGPYLKICGYDALEIQGKAAKDTMIVIDAVTGKISFEDAAEFNPDSHIIAEELIDRFSGGDENKKRFVSVISSGKAAEHTLIGMLNFSFYDTKRKKVRFKQAGRGGIGTVLRDKNIKAIVIRVPKVDPNMNNPVNVDAIKERGKRFNYEMTNFDDQQSQMRKCGTAHLVEIMDAYDLLPVHNFQYGKHSGSPNIDSNVWKKRFTQDIFDGCWLGCTMSCCKAVDDFELKTGPYKGQKVIVDGPEYETVGGVGSNCGIFDADYIIECNFYCDTYGIDTISFGTIVAFAMECYERGILNKERTGGLELKFGNKEAAYELIHQMARGEGFGKIAGMGVRKMKEYFIKHYNADPQLMQDIGMENKGLEYSQYNSKESLAQQGGYAMTNKGPQHDEAWLIFMDMVNKQIPTFEDKAEALHYFPMFRTWFGLQGLCKLPWNDVEPENNAQTDEPAKVPEHVDNYVTIYNAVTGNNIDKHELIRQSERVYNFQRIFNLRRGYGLRKHDAQPYRACGPVTKEEYLSREDRYDKQLVEEVKYDITGKTVEEKMAALRKYREDRYEKLLDAVYKRRGWTPNGVPTIEHLKKLKMDLPELIELVSKHQ